MKTKNFFYLLFFVFMFLIQNCADPVLDPAYQQPEFGLYLFRNETIETSDIQDDPLDSMILQNEPWLSLEDIAFYDYSAHCIYLKKDKESFEHEFLHNNGTPFIPVVNGEKCYLGSFWSNLSSSSIPHSIPRIEGMEWSSMYPEDVIHIKRSIAWESDNVADLRFDESIKNALIGSGKYCGGLKVELVNVVVLSNSDTSAVKYTVKISNNDQDDLYVPDPVKMGGYYFYYTNGLCMRRLDLQEGQDYQLRSIYSKSPDPYDSWDFEWFTRIESGESITREYTILVDECIESGEYECKLWYEGPTNIDKETRTRPDGRIWIGRIWSSSFYLDTNSGRKK